MKKISKISAVLLSVALMITAFAVMAAAEEPVNEYDKHAVLEYFEAGHFLNESFNDSDIFDDASDEFKTSGVIGYTSNEDGTVTMQSVSPVYFDITTGDSISFGINTAVKLDSADKVKPSSFALNIHSSGRGAAGNNATTLFKVTPFEIRVLNGFDKDGAPSYKTITVVSFDAEGKPGEGQSPIDNFSVEFFFKKGEAADELTLKLTRRAADNSEIVDSFVMPASSYSLKAFDITFKNITMDYCEMYKGSFVRRLSDNNAEIAAHINKLAELYTKGGADAFECAEIASKVLVTYEFSDEAVSEGSGAMLQAVAEAYAKAYVDGAKSIDTSKAYYDALEAMEAIEPYDDFIEKLLALGYEVDIKQSAEDIEAATDLINAEFARISKMKSDTISAYDIIKDISSIYSISYEELKQAKENVDKYPICSTYYDETHSTEDIANVLKTAASIVVEFNRQDSAAKIFVENVPIMCNPSNTFAVRHAAYVLAKDNFFDDVSYNKYILSGKTVEALVADYNKMYEEIEGIANYANQFLLKIKEAEEAPSYAAKINALDAAQSYLESVERSYPGVSDAVDRYYTIRRAIDEKVKATRSYINAVLAVENAKTTDEKLRAIEIAKKYAVLGSDLSVIITDMQITVTEANIILAKEEAAINLVKSHADSFIAAVNAISAKTDIMEKRSAIKRAIQIKEGVDITIEGVSDSITILNGAIADYNAKVNAANEKSAECNELALTTVSRTIPTESVAQIVAVIKKFFD